MIPAQSPSISMHGVNYWFGAGEARIQVIFDASLTIERGSFTILRGPSGSGKTTLLTLMGCLRKLQDGSIRLLGQELRDADNTAQQVLRRRLGFIFQAHNLHESLTARQNTLMGLQVHGPGGDTAKQNAAAVRLLESLGLGSRRLLARKALRWAKTARGHRPRAGVQPGNRFRGRTHRCLG